MNLRPPQIPWSQYFTEIFRFKSDPLEAMISLNERYGDLIYFGGPLNTLFLFNINHIETVFIEQKNNNIKGKQGKLLRLALGDGLLVREKDEWRRRRKLISRVFHHKEIASYLPMIKEKTLQYLEEWKKQPEVNLTHELSSLTFEIAGEIFLGGVPNEIVTRFNEAVLNIGKVLTSKLSSPINLPLSINTPGNALLKREVSFIDEFIFKKIHDERISASNDNSLLNRLILAEEGLTDKEIRDELVTFLVAGYETTAAFLTWSLYLFLKENHVETWMSSFEDREKRRKSLREVLRLYPSVPLISRQCENSFKLGDFEISAGTNFVVSPFVIQRNEKYYTDAHKVDFERVQEKSFIPFSLGPKRCIGEELSFSEVETILHTLFSQSKITLKTKELHPVCKIALYTDRPLICSFS